MGERTCSINGCDGRTGQSGTARGLCGQHYRQWRAAAGPGPAQRSCAICGSALPLDRRRGEYCGAACALAAQEMPGPRKQCSVCRTEKPLPEFQRKTRSKDGRASVCRSCDNRRRIQRKVDAGLRRPDPAPGHKWCSECDTEKPLTEFYARLTGPTAGRPYAWCRECVKARNVARARQRGVAPRRQAHPEAVRRTRLKRDYNMTLESYYLLLEQQGRRCAGCRMRWEDRERDQWFSVDHDHSCCSGTISCGYCVRGLLCVGCNFAAGHARDDPRVLRRLADYLERGRRAALHPAS